MMTSVRYSYAEGDLLEQRHSYQYSAYQGMPFLAAWKEHRRTIRAALGAPTAAPAAEGSYDPGKQPPWLLSELLEDMMDGIERGLLEDAPLKESLRRWVKKFEVSKRLYSTYDIAFKRVDGAMYRDAGLYLRFAEVVDSAYTRSAELPYLNVLLKVMDTLIAMRDSLDANQRARLAGLLDREMMSVAALGQQCGLLI